ncbi:MAG: thiol:disulfide interchange protein DsbA/DsbL [Proteobacteria bacterium]|nr:thiol:disulfide interchange protein DsbA/DsbL [Pseudomonadota bacterium]
MQHQVEITMLEMKTLRRLRAALLVAAGALFVSAMLARPATAQLVEGTNYTKLRQPIPVETGKKIEVIEFFSFGCPHCAHLEPILDKWIAAIPPDVEFRRVPVTFFKPWENLAKVWYTLDALNETKLAPAVFVAIHEKSQNLADPKTFYEWAAANGLDRKKVEDMYGSFTINSKLARAKQLAQQFDIQSVPTVVVDGKFVTASDRVGGHENLPKAINELVARARAERAKG